MKKENAIFARNLREYIAVSGREQKQICADLGIPESSMSDYVRGKSIPRYKTIDAIAEYFGVRMSDLMIESEFDYNTAHQQRINKLWIDSFPDVVWTADEVNELIQFGKYLISKRG